MTADGAVLGSFEGMLEGAALVEGRLLGDGVDCPATRLVASATDTPTALVTVIVVLGLPEIMIQGVFPQKVAPAWVHGFQWC